MNTEQIKAYIDDNIKHNTSGAITAQMVNSTLKEIVDNSDYSHTNHTHSIDDVDTLSGTIQAIDYSMSVVEAGVTGLGERIDADEVLITGLDTRTTTLEAGVSGLQTGVSGWNYAANKVIEKITLNGSTTPVTVKNRVVDIDPVKERGTFSGTAWDTSCTINGKYQLLGDYCTISFTCEIPSDFQDAHYLLPVPYVYGDSGIIHVSGNNQKIRIRLGYRESEGKSYSTMVFSSMDGGHLVYDNLIGTITYKYK